MRTLLIEATASMKTLRRACVWNVRGTVCKPVFVHCRGSIFHGPHGPVGIGGLDEGMLLVMWLCVSFVRMPPIQGRSKCLNFPLWS